MIFSVFRYASGVTAAAPHDERLLRDAMISPDILGMIRQIDAPRDDIALLAARERFARGDFEFTVEGKRVAKRLLGGWQP